MWVARSHAGRTDEHPSTAYEHGTGLRMHSDSVCMSMSCAGEARESGGVACSLSHRRSSTLTLKEKSVGIDSGGWC